MAIQVNLDNQTFWAPRPLSRPRCVEGQSQSRRAVPQPKSSLPSNANRGVIDVPKESLVSSPRQVSSRDDFIYISDAASDMSDASHEPLDETLPSVQAIVQSLEDAGKIGSAVGDCDQTSQHKGEDEAAPRLASSTSFENGETTERPRPSVELAVECPTDFSTSTSRLRTSMPTSLFARSQTSSPSCDSSLWATASLQTRCTSMSANDEGAKQTSTSEITQRVDSQLHSLSSASQSQPTPLRPDHDRTMVDITEESPGPSQQLPSSTDNIIYVSDMTSDRADASSHEPCATSPPFVQIATQSLEGTENLGTTTQDCDQTSKYEDKREATPRSILPTPDETQANQRAGFSSAELAGCSNVLASSTSRNTASMAPPGSVISQVVSPSPGGRSEDPVSTQISRASMSAARERPVQAEKEKCTESNLPETSVCEPKVFERTDGKTMMTKPLTSRTRSQLQNTWRRELSAEHDTMQHEVEGSPRESDEPEYRPSTCDEPETDSDRHGSDEDQPPRKRRKARSTSAKTKSQIQEIVQHESAGSDQGSQLISTTADDAHNMGTPIIAAFDEWLLQDVLLQRTVMDGKATFLFQFDWDLCMKHGAETGRGGSMKQGRGKPIVKSNKRSCRKPRDETKGRQCRRCGRPGHNARTCQGGSEILNEDGSS